MHSARLDGYGLLRVEGADARTFLHAQLTVDVEQLAAGHARHAGWCSAKGRLLATFVLIALEDGFLLQLARDLAAPVAKRLSMFVLRAKVKVTDQSATPQYGVWGAGAAEKLRELGIGAPGASLEASHAGGAVAVCLGSDRYLLIGPAALEADSSEQDWALQDIQAGVPMVSLATQDQLVPQMANLELLGGVDFRKGCYPGQEIVARAQYRGEVKRRMYRLRSSVPLASGQELFADGAPEQAAGTVLNAARDEALAVLQVSAAEGGTAIRAARGGAPLQILPLPYSR
jgi:folate-binding protein YgfZ